MMNLQFIHINKIKPYLYFSSILIVLYFLVAFSLKAAFDGLKYINFIIDYMPYFIALPVILLNNSFIKSLEVNYDYKYSFRDYIWKLISNNKFRLFIILSVASLAPLIKFLLFKKFSTLTDLFFIELFSVDYYLINGLPLFVLLIDFLFAYTFFKSNRVVNEQYDPRYFLLKLALSLLLILGVAAVYTSFINYSLRSTPEFKYFSKIKIAQTIFWTISSGSSLFLLLVLLYSLYINSVIYQFNKNIVNLYKGLGSIKNFADVIGRGEFNISLETSEETSELSRYLHKMRDSLKSNETDKVLRNWKIEAVSELNYILNKHETQEALHIDLVTYLEQKLDAVQVAIYFAEEKAQQVSLELKYAYAYKREKHLKGNYKIGEGFIGAAAFERDIVYRTEVPSDYFRITTGILGEIRPSCICAMPLLSDDKLLGVIEMAFINELKPDRRQFIKEIGPIIGQKLFNLSINDNTRNLLNEIQTREITTQALLENASEVIIIFDLNQTIRYISPSVERILGYTQSEMLGHQLAEFTFGRNTEILDKANAKIYQENALSDLVQFSFMQKHGENIMLEAAFKNLISDAAIKGVVVNLRDITLKLKAEQEEKKSGAMRALSENSPDLIIRINTNGDIFYINPAIKLFTDHDPQHYISKRIDDVELNDDFLKLLRVLMHTVMSTKENYNQDFSYKGINDIEININAIPEFNTEGETDTVLFVIHDVTETKQYQNKIEETNKKITESIEYAQKIQTALFPDVENFENNFKDSFILFNPKDIVSGDFYWISEIDDKVIYATADCTGHGVPGGFMSMLGTGILSEIINTKKITSPAVILNEMRDQIISSLRQTGAENESKDGMDVVLCCIDKKTLELTYASAYNIFYIVSKKGEITYSTADKMPVGFHFNMPPFNEHKVQLKTGDTIYTFTDGYADQFGGPNKKKFKYKQLEQLLIDIHLKPMKEQKEILDMTLSNWRGSLEQIDDVLMIGVKI
jgi:PAS domain S-box-containing protein